MIAASALVSGNDPDPRLAEEAVAVALQSAGLERAAGLLLFLTPEFTRQAQPALTAAARRAQCLEIAGGIASGVFTEQGWALDRPSAVALVLGDALAFGPAGRTGRPTMCYAGRQLSGEGAGDEALYGASFAGALAGGEETLVWQHGRVAEDRLCRVQWRHASVDVGASRGWLALGEAQRVDAVHGYDIERLDGLPARRRLAQILPPGMRDDPARHLHHIVALPLPPAEAADRRAPAVAPLSLIALNAGGTLTVSERVPTGLRLQWAVRQPETTLADMRRMLDALAGQAAGRATPPACALLFSCIGRGPYYYGGEDLDLQAFREHFPGLPAIGVYATGQFASGSALCQNTVVAALIRPAADAA